MARPISDLAASLTPEVFARRALELRSEAEMRLAEVRAGGFPAKDIRAAESALRKIEKLITKHGLTRFVRPSV